MSEMAYSKPEQETDLRKSQENISILVRNGLQSEVTLGF